MAIIVRSIVWPFAYAQGVQSSLTLGRNIIVEYLNLMFIWCLTLNRLLNGRFFTLTTSHLFLNYKLGMGDKPPFLGFVIAIIVRSIVWPFAIAQGVQSSLTLGRNIKAVC